MPSVNLTYTLHHRWRDRTIDFEACSVKDALDLLGWDIRKVTIESWRCEACDNTGYTREGDVCLCPVGELEQLHIEDQINERNLQ